jgi:glucosamine 6-phosphate synthetase-like amidotransferase/phosphosugar isomerase protein
MSKKSSLISMYEAKSNLINLNDNQLTEINKKIQSSVKKPLSNNFKQEMKELNDMKKTFGKKKYPHDNYKVVYKEQYIPYFRQVHLTMLSRWENDVKYI